MFSIIAILAPTPSINLAVSTEPTSHNTASANTPPSRPPTNHMSVAGVRNQNPTQIGHPSGPSSSCKYACLDFTLICEKKKKILLASCHHTIK